MHTHKHSEPNTKSHSLHLCACIHNERGEVLQCSSCSVLTAMYLEKTTYSHRNHTICVLWHSIALCERTQEHTHTHTFVYYRGNNEVSNTSTWRCMCTMQIHMYVDWASGERCNSQMCLPPQRESSLQRHIYSIIYPRCSNTCVHTHTHTCTHAHTHSTANCFYPTTPQSNN